MVDYFALALTHVLLALAAWRLAQRDDLDEDPPASDAGESGEARPARAPQTAPRPGVPRLKPLVRDDSPRA